MDSPNLILASTSPRRIELLRHLGVEFRAIPAEISEIEHEELSPRELAQINAYRKARAVAKKHPDTIVLAADTVVWLEGKFFGKPADLEEAYVMLQLLSGRTHEVVTAVCLLHLRPRRQKIFSDSTHVTFHTLDAVKIRRYLNQVNPLDKAGAYGIQERGEELVEKIAGSYSNVVGLPLERLVLELQSWAGIPAAFSPTLSSAALKFQGGSQPTQFLP